MTQTQLTELDFKSILLSMQIEKESSTTVGTRAEGSLDFGEKNARTDNCPSVVSSDCCGLQSFLCIRALLLDHC